MASAKKLRFHFPLYFVKENRLYGADYCEARSELIKRWSAVCDDSFNSYTSRLFIRGFEYDEELFVIYCADEDYQMFITIFVDITSKYHEQLQQEYYIYEEEDIQVKVFIGGEWDQRNILGRL